MEIDLAETVEALRAELRKAVAAAGDDADIQFPVTGVQVEFHVGVKKTADGKAGFKFWVVELGTGGQYAAESIQKVIVNFGPPVGRDGVPIKVAKQTGGRALATRRGSVVRYPRRTHTYYVESGDREAGELLEVLKGSDPGERWLAVRDIRPFLVESGVLGALGLALLDPDEWVADAARMVLQNFSDEYAVNQLDSRSLELLGTDEVLSALVDRMAADTSDANVIAWLLQQREHLPALLRMYTAGRTELRRVLWAIADRHQLRLFDDGTALLPSGETVPWPELATAAY